MKIISLVLTLLMFLAIVIPFVAGTQCNGSYNLDPSKPFSSKTIKITNSNNISICGSGQSGLYDACRDYSKCIRSFISAHSFPFWKLLFMALFGVMFYVSMIDDKQNITTVKIPSTKKKSAPNYTEEMTEDIVTTYKSVANAPFEKRQEVIEKIAKKYGKTPRSIMAKLSAKGVYVPRGSSSD